MKIVRFHLQPYNLPMTSPIQLTHHTFTTKSGWFLTAENDLGHCARAEIPCLPGVHPVSQEDVPSLLNPLLDSIKDTPLSDTPRWDHPLFDLLPLPHLPIPFLFALESLMLAFYRTCFLERFQLPSCISVPINELFIPGSFETHAPSASTLKVKLPGLADPASLLASLNCRLRLDPNRTLSPTQLKSLLSHIPPNNLEYIEDPYPDLWEGLKQFSQFPLALDKELAPALRSKRFPSNTVALVLKPSRDLAISGALKLILQKKYHVTISSAYETPLGLWPLIHLAAVSRTPCGLDVQKLFKPTPDLCFHPHEKGRITLRPLSSFF